MSARITPAHLERIVRRAATDMGFRARLLTDPKPALEEALGATLPPDVRLKFIEKPAEYDALIVLPDATRVWPGLSGSELESVSGGAADEAAQEHS